MLQEGRGAEAVPLLTEVQDDFPRTPGLWLLLAEAQLAVGDMAAASRAGARLLELLPDDTIALTTMGRIELRNGQFGAAEKHLRQVLAVEPDNGDFHKMLIDALMGQGKLEAASAELAALPEANAMEPAVLVAKGRIALARDKPAEAESHLRNALDANPATMTLLWLSGAIAAQGRDDEVIMLLNDWLVDYPADVLVRNQLASTYLQLGQDQEAREQYQKIMEKVPDNVLVLNNLAWLLRDDDPQRALAYIERANGLAPDNPLVMDTYAMIQLGLSAKREALSLNQKALELMPNSPEILYHRALILHADGQSETAIPILETLVGSTNVAQREQAQSLLADIQGLSR
jgi:tetratricopeptide (TPR) repeat protein